MNRTDQSTPLAPSARRRLIRGALAAPALMTVLSGSAFAAASTHCVANAQNLDPQPQAGVTGSPDTYLRVRLWKVTEPHPSTLTPTFINGSDLGTFPRGLGIPSATQYLKIDENTYTTVNSGPQDGLPAGSGAYINKWAALRFDADGKIVGIGAAQSTPGGALLSLSCWHSAFPHL